TRAKAAKALSFPPTAKARGLPPLKGRSRDARGRVASTPLSPEALQREVSRFAAPIARSAAWHDSCCAATTVTALIFLDHEDVARAREEDEVMLRRMPGWWLRLLAALATIAVLMGPLSVKAAGGTGNEVAAYS